MGDNIQLNDIECKEKGFSLVKLFSKARRPKFFLEENRGVHEYIGKVKVVLVKTPKRIYREKSLGSALVILAFFTIGATAINIFFYSLSLATETLTSLHVLLFTAGFQLFIPVSFLVMNTYNGASSFIKTGHRRIDYLLIKITGLVCVICGLLTAFASPSLRLADRAFTCHDFDIHAFIGVVAVFLCIVDIVMLVCLPCNSKRLWPRMAFIVCFPSFVMSSVCFILGLYKRSFIKWLPLPVMLYFFMAFCIYYTVFAVVNPYLNLAPSDRDDAPVPYIPNDP